MQRKRLMTIFVLSGLATQALATDLEFSPVEAPVTDAAKRQVIASATALIAGQPMPLGFTLLARTGDVIGVGTYGQIVDQAGGPLHEAGSFEGVPNRADYASLLPVGGKVFSVSHTESRPGALYLTTLDQDAAGRLSATSTRPIDLSAVGGLWNPCAGSVTPWNTHLGSEEGPSDARNFETATSLKDLKAEAAMAAYFGIDAATTTVDAVRTAVNPYRYGHVVEVAVTGNGEAQVAKRLAMGRMSVELATLMPDGKTAYITDDTTNGGLFRFVADTPGDLSSGRLFAAKWLQTSAENGGAAMLEWVDLGHADDEAINAGIQAGAVFSSLFETADMVAGGKCPDGFAPSHAETRAECLKVRTGMEALASRLESRRFAAMKGATTEFHKFEGSAVDPAQHVLYIAASTVSAGMEDNSFEDFGGANDIRLPQNSCGAVYAMTLDENWVGTRIEAAISGQTTAYGAESPFSGQTCAIDGIANPDNLAFIAGAQTLIVAEDTIKGHQNDAIWAYRPADKTLTRILTTPYGAEATAVSWQPDVNGHGYLSVVVQHPYGESDQALSNDLSDTRAYFGYMGPFPVIKQTP